MALTFGAAISDRVNHGSAASLDSLAAFTMLFWVYPTTLTGSRALWDKGSVVAPFLHLDPGNSDELRVRINQATSATEYVTNNANLTTNKWWFIAVTYDSAVTPRHRILLGDLSTLATERTYSQTDNGAGARASDAANDYLIGNRVSLTLAWQGRIAFHGCWNRALSNGEIQTQQFRPCVTSGCILFTHLGYNETSTQLDWSGNGNNGTVTGATTADHVSIMPAFGYDLGWQGAFTPVAAFPRLMPLMGVA